MQLNVASQKWTVFAFGGAGHASEGQPIAGDAAQITANLRLDGGAANAVDDVNPTELEDGYYVFDITQAESNGDLLHISPESSTANVEVIGLPAAIYTTPASFNADVIQTGDSFVRLGAAGVGLSAIPIVPANVTQISGDTVAADNLEAMYDGTGYTDETGPASRSQVDGIGAASGGSLSFQNEADNVSVPIKSITFDGVETSGTNASTNFEDGVYHNIDDTANNIDIVYQFDVGGGRTAVEMTFKGYLNGGNDNATIQAYNGTGWDDLMTIDGKNGNTNDTLTAALFSAHTGAGADIGLVFIRIECAAQSNPSLFTDQLIVSAVNIGQSIGYSGARVWIDTVDGVAGTESFVNGVADNKSLTLPDALIIANAINLKIFEATRDSVLAPAADFNNFTVYGTGYTFTLGGFDYAGTHIYHASPLTGVATAVNNSDHFDVLDSIVGNVTVDNAHFTSCALTGTVTLGAINGTFRLVNCFSLVAGSSSFILDFGTTTDDHNASVVDFQGAIEIQNYNVVTTGGTDTLNVTGIGAIVINANCDGGTINLRGIWEITDNSGGAVTIVQDDVSTELAKVPKSDGTVTWNPIALASINTQADTALADIFLHQLLAADYDPASKPGTATALLNELVEDDAGVSRYTANALENAPSGSGGVGAAHTTTIATLASQVSFTLTAGSADDNAYRGWGAVITDVATSTQKAFGIVTAYTGATLTVTLLVDPGIFTMVATDSIELIPANLVGGLSAQAKLDVNVESDTALEDIHLDHLLAADYDPASKPGTVTALLNEIVEDDAGVSRFTVNALENAPSGTGASAAVIADAVWDEAQADHVIVDSFGVTASEIAAIPTTAMRGTDGAATAAVLGAAVGASISADIAAVKADSAAVLIDTNELQTDNVPGLIAALNDLAAGDILTTALTESYNTDGSPPTLTQALMLTMQMLTEKTVSGTTVTVAQLDGSTTAFTLTLDSATAPASVTRAT